MSDSEHSTITYTILSEDDFITWVTSLQTALEEPEQAPPSPIYVPFVPEPVYPEFLPVDDETDYPADRRDDEDEHLAPAEPAAVAYSADQDPYIAYRATVGGKCRQLVLPDQFGPTTARADLYGFADTCACSRTPDVLEIRLCIRDTWMIGWSHQDIAPTTLRGGQPESLLS
ncbi:integrase, catalytic region, zinc finger, CCHC-type containing protein [Tanacetum coccineum]|uniref:Integrase, catalytic region, zinc finger, CCHC-type containing protein n=1 Tax=Tanacetum coccineum TaxID=301880 RepID=A0ABQ5DXZ2_9ASTR